MIYFPLPGDSRLVYLRATKKNDDSSHYGNLVARKMNSSPCSPGSGAPNASKERWWGLLREQPTRCPTRPRYPGSQVPSPCCFSICSVAGLQSKTGKDWFVPNISQIIHHIIIIQSYSGHIFVFGWELHPASGASSVHHDE